jgi:hypothetical protein
MVSTVPDIPPKRSVYEITDCAVLDTGGFLEPLQQIRVNAHIEGNLCHRYLTLHCVTKAVQ